MKLFRTALLAAPLLLAACAGGTPPPPASGTSSAPPPAATTAAATPANTDAIAPILGTWAADLKQCGQTAGPISISAKRFEGAENGCDIGGFTDNGDGTVTAALSCNSQGQTAKENIKLRPIFGPSGEGIEMVYVDRDNKAFVVYRCEQKTTN
jgi:hypothetical protein